MLRNEKKMNSNEEKVDWDYCKYPDGMHVDDGSFCSYHNRYHFQGTRVEIIFEAFWARS